MRVRQVKITIPTLHDDQERAFMHEPDHRFKAVRCGRRWGKTTFGETVSADCAINGGWVGWFAPDYKYQAEVYSNFKDMLEPIIDSASRIEGVMRFKGGGRIDFWTLENPDAGRSRSYDLVIVDEAAFTKPGTINTWERSIKPTLLDRLGSALVLSNTNGIDSENFFWQICNEPRHGFIEYHAPSHSNPYLPAEELKRLEEVTPPLVFSQEYRAEFVDWSGVAFFSRDDMLVENQPVEWPSVCDSVYATIDTALKEKRDNDGTAVSYYAKSAYFGYPLVILDWDIQQMEGAILVEWLPSVYANLEIMARQCGARFGSAGVFIEDKNSGTVLIQQAQQRNWPAEAIDPKLTALGKDGRAVNISAHIYQKNVKISRRAYDKVTTYKETTRNHFLAQVCGFRVGLGDVQGRQDDLLDTFTCGVALGLGNAYGY